MKKITKIGLALGGAALGCFGVYEAAKHGIIDGLDGTSLYLERPKNDDSEEENKEE